MLGWPLLPTAAFVIWLLIIVALALLMELRAAGGEPGDDEQAQRPLQLDR